MNNIQRFTAEVARSYGVDDATHKFAVTAPMETRMFETIQASVDFLNHITMMGVIDSKGQAVTMTIPGSVSGRTPAGTARSTQTIGAFTGSEYTCEPTQADVTIPYTTLDVWARHKDFLNAIGGMINKRRALDILLCGWNGTSCAATTNRTQNPLLQDVNKGWLQIMRENKPSHVIDEGEVQTGKVVIGSTGDYKTLDSLVSGLLDIIPEHLRTGNEVAIISSDLKVERTNLILDAVKDPQQASALNDLSFNRIGTLPVVSCPGFPSGKVVVCDRSMLHYYYQLGSVRKLIIDEPKYSSITDYVSSSTCYAIECLDAVVVAENVIYAEPEEEATTTSTPA